MVFNLFFHKLKIEFHWCSTRCYYWGKNIITIITIITIIHENNFINIIIIIIGRCGEFLVVVEALQLILS